MGGHDFVGRDDVAARLRHLLPVLRRQQHALIAQLGERLIEVDQPGVVHHLGPEAGVQQVHDGVLRAADVGIDRQPGADGGRVERPLGLVRAGEAQEVPRRTGEAVHRVRLALGRAAALRTGDVDPIGDAGQRRTAVLARRERHLFGQQHRQLLFRHRNRATGGTVDDGDGRAPIALAGDQPVTEAVGDVRPPQAAGGQVGGHLLGCGGRRQAIIGTGVDQNSFAFVGRVAG